MLHGMCHFPIQFALVTRGTWIARKVFLLPDLDKDRIGYNKGTVPFLEVPDEYVRVT